ncbi:MAG: AhpC/TSA family protein [Planctomycetota bacterium]
MDSPDRQWMKTTLFLAGCYNLLWGAWVVLRPDDLFVWSGADLPRYPGIWQCVGMIVGVYGVGYLCAARDPFKHWPVVLVGFLGKIFGPIGFVQQVFLGDPETGLPLSWGWTIVTNDLIWWIPFATILYLSFKHHNAPELGEELTFDDVLERFTLSDGISVAAASHDRPLMLVFLRHTGCTFCREAIEDVARDAQSIDHAGKRLVLVTMSETSKFRDTLVGTGLEEVDVISDPECQLYRVLEIPRGTLSQLFGPSVWWRGFGAAILDRQGVGMLDGDGFQLGGVFVINRGKVISGRPLKTAADRPDYCQIASAG